MYLQYVYYRTDSFLQEVYIVPMVQSEKVRKEFSQRLAQACEQAGLSQHGRGAAIVKAIGVTSKAVSKWFNAESLPRQDKIYALANFLKCDPIWLQHGKINPASHIIFDNNLKSFQETLTPEHIELIELFNDLPEEKALYFLEEMRKQKKYFDSVFNEMLKKKKNNPL